MPAGGGAGAFRATARLQRLFTDPQCTGLSVFVGQRNVGQEELHTHSAGSVIKIVPVIAGAGRGFLNVVLGAVLIGLAFWNPLAMPAWLIGGMKAVGTSLALS